MSAKTQLPLKVDMLFLMERTKGHYNAKGELSTEGLRHPLPEARKPDVDNAQKLILDALNGRAYKDDVQVTTSRQRKRWSNVSGVHVRITLDEDDRDYSR